MLGSLRPSFALLIRSPFLPLLLLTLLATYPLLRDGYPMTVDGNVHFYRLVDLDWNLRQGILYPRWSTQLGLGHGFPIFNYYPPLTYYLAEIFHLAGLRFDQSLVAVYVIGFGLATFGAYRLGQMNFGTRGGFVTAAAYSLAPYPYFDAFGRGAVPEFLALAILPWALSSAQQITQTRDRTSLVLLVISVGAILLTNVPAALLALPLILVWAMIHGLREPSRRSTVLLALGFLLPFMIAAFFLVPVAFELQEVQIDQLYRPSFLDFRAYFLSLPQLASWPGPFDGRLVEPQFGLSLSLGGVLLAGIGLASLSRHRTKRPATAAAWLILGVLVVGMLSISTWVWELSRIGRFIQFPFRLLGPASLFLALAAAPSAHLMVRRGWIVGAWSLCFVASLPWTFSVSPPPPVDPGIQDLRDHEVVSGRLGTTSMAEYLPTAVKVLPPPRPVSEEPLGLLDTDGSVPILSSEIRPLDHRYVVRPGTATTLTLEAFYFPGWSVTLDGDPVSIRASEPHGLILVDLPAGTHELRVWFGSTVPRNLGTGVSVLGLMLLGAIWLRLPGQQQGESRAVAAAAEHGQDRASLPLLLSGAAVILFLSRVTLVDGRSTPFSASLFDGESVSSAEHPLAVNFEDRFQLMGLDAPTSGVSGSSIPITLYWRALSPPDGDYSTSVRLTDSDGRIFGRSDRWDPGGLATSHWRTDRYAIDEHALPVTPGTPPGRYRLITVVYRTTDLSTLSVFDQEGLAIGPFAEVSEMEITRPSTPPSADALDFAMAARHAFGPLELLGYSLPEVSLTPGTILDIPAYWRVHQTTPRDLVGELIIASGQGYSRSVPVRLARADYPSSLWREGEVVRGILSLSVPADAPPGPATLSIRVIEDGQDFGRLRLGTLKVQPVARRTDRPEVPNPEDVIFGGRIRLHGYGSEVSAEEVTVTLFWETLTQVTRNYTVFVHLLDSDGRVAAQKDSAPLGGDRPTSGWMPGEFLIDPHAIQAGPGAYTVEVGIYDPTTGDRLKTRTGQDHVILGSVNLP